MNGATATVPIYLKLRLTKINAPPGRAATGGRRHGKGIKEPKERMRLSASRCGDELLTFFGVSKAERLHEEFRRRVRLVASGQIKLRRIDGWRKIAAVLQHTPVAA